MMYPKRMYFIVVMEFCERFSFSSLRSVLSFYMRDVLLYEERQAIDIYHVFMMLCYISAIIGGIVGNSDYGKYKTILSFSFVYWTGILILFWTTVETQNTSKNFSTLVSIVLVAIGMGGIKSSIAAFGVDQLIGEDQYINSTHVHDFFGTFYFAIHLGVFFGLFASPAISKIELYKGRQTYVYAITFGLPTIMMTIAITVFVCGNSYYLFKKPLPNILPQMIKCIGFITWKQLTSCCEKQKKINWLEYAYHGSFSSRIINDTKKTLHMLLIYIPMSMFWSLFDQQNTTWIFQAARTKGVLFGVKFPVCMLQVVNPLLVLLSIPLMERIVYPYLKSHRLFKYPLKRMLLGGGIAGMSFFFAGCIEIYLEKHSQYANPIDTHRCFAYKKPCLENNIIWTSNSGLQKLYDDGLFVVDSFTKSFGKCTDVHENSKIQILESERYKKMYKNNRHKSLEKNQNSIVLLVMGMDGSPFKDLNISHSQLTVFVPENLIQNLETNHPSIIIFPANISADWSQVENITLQSKDIDKTIIFQNTQNVSRFQNTNIPYIPPGLYTMTVNYMNSRWKSNSMTVLNLEADHVHLYARYNNETISDLQSKSYVLSKEWLLPQFICMAFGETLFTMTGLAFSFTEAPETMKTVSISMWYFSVALGNLAVIFINKIITFKKKSHMFFVFVFNTLLAIVVTYKLSNTFEKTYGSEDSDTGKVLDIKETDLVTLSKKKSYQLSF